MKGTNRLRLLAISSALGGAAGVLLIIGFGLTGWGPPGSAAYRTYELLNRLMAIALLIMAPGWLGMWHWRRGTGRWRTLVAGSGVLVVAAGTGAEFWLYSDLPYEGDSMRQAAYATASVGSLVLYLGATATGIALWRAGRSGWLTVCMLLTLPLDVTAFFLLGLPIMAPVLALVVSRLSWQNGLVQTWPQLEKAVCTCVSRYRRQSARSCPAKIHYNAAHGQCAVCSPQWQRIHEPAD